MNPASRKVSIVATFPAGVIIGMIVSVIFMTNVSGMSARAEEPLSLVGRHSLMCPICSEPFAALSSSQTNTRGGTDRDLFTRAVGPQPEYYRVSTCPRCGYSGYLTDFNDDVRLMPDFRRRITQEPKLKLPDGFGPQSDPRELDALDRYRLAIQCYQWSQKSDEALAWLNLRASWVARDEGSMLPKDLRLARVLQFAERWRPDLSDAGDQYHVEMQLVTRMLEALTDGQFNRYQRPYVELAVALILRRHGENRQAGPLLDGLVSEAAFSESLRTGIEKMRASIVLERQFQTEAARCFEQALLAERIVGANRASAKYLLGELYRRLGRDRDAIRWYDEVLRDPTISPPIREWANEQRAWSIGQPATKPTLTPLPR
ncbi:MAG: DUF2225 domain-containing protein [Phycisphaerae bacterium]|nr:DUF2225 domain-containing protein [Phycisphaerae bacterium]